MQEQQPKESQISSANDLRAVKSHIRPRVPRIIFLFTLYRCLTRLYFHLPFLVLIFIVSRNYSYLQTGVFLSTFSLPAFVGAPTLRKILDGRNLKFVLFVAEALKMSALLLLIIASNAYWLILAQYLAGLGYMLSMGSDSQALRYGLGKDEEQYLRSERNAHAVVFISLALAAIISPMGSRIHTLCYCFC